MTISRAAAAFGIVALLGLPAVSQATPYDAEYVFGDSLSDNGNLAEGLFQQNFPNPPSYHDSFTNGPVAAQILAGQLGLSLNPSLWVTGFVDANGLFGGPSYVPGTNYAVAGATSAASALGGVSPLINLPQQVAAFGSHVGAADPNALYIVDIGGNDVRLAAKSATGSPAVVAGVSAELQSVQALASLGAKNFLVVNVPNVGVIPEFTQDNPGLVAAATLYSQQYDQMLASGLSSLLLPPGTNISQFDLYSFNTNLIANASALGFTDTADRCYTATPLSAATSPQCGPNAANINSFFYWDSIHPSARVQALWETGFAAAIGVPEPSSLVLLAAGLAGVLGWRRRVSAAG